MECVKLILGEDRTPHLDSLFGNYNQRRYYASEKHNVDKRDLKKEEDEAKERESEAENLFHKFKLKNVKQLIEEKPLRLTTGCRYMDEFLRGGIPTGRLIEIFGEGGTGKTQFAIQLLINSVLPIKRGGLGGKSLLISTSKPLSETRYHAIMSNVLEQNAGYITEDDIDKSVKHFEGSKFETYNDIIDKLEDTVESEKIKLIIVDNIATICDHFINQEIGVTSVDYFARATFLDRQALTFKNLAYKKKI